MFTETGRGKASQQCPYCGGKLYAPLMFCPHCGANQAVAPPEPPSSARAAAREARPRVPTYAERLRAYWSALPANFGGGRLYSNGYLPADTDSFDESAPHHSRLPFYALGSVALLACTLGAYVLAHRDEHEPAAGSMQVVEGSVTVPQHMQHMQQAQQPQQAFPQPRPAKNAALRGAAELASAPPHREVPAPAPTVINTPRIEAPVHEVDAQKPGGNSRGDVQRDLAFARDSLNKNNLWRARQAITEALAVQPANGDAQQLRADLNAREKQRDSVLGFARLCARDGQWDCVWHNAGNALSIDASSREAKRLLARAMSEQGGGGDVSSRSRGEMPPGPYDVQ